MRAPYVRLAAYAGVRLRGGGVDANGDAIFATTRQVGRPEVMPSLSSGTSLATIRRLVRKLAAWVDDPGFGEALREGAERERVPR